MPAGGVQTRIGVQLHPKLHEPHAGVDHVPENESNAKGYRGELNLANHITMRVSNEVVIRFGNRAGVNGPDIVSVGENGSLIQEVRNGQPGEPRRVRWGEIEQTGKDPSGKDRR